MATRTEGQTKKRAGARSDKTGQEHINDQAIKRLAKVAGCERISQEAYPVIKEIIMKRLAEIVRQAAILQDAYKKKRFSIDILLLTLERMGKKHYPADAKTFTICKSKEAIKSGGKRGNCLFVAPVAFRRLLKETAQGHMREGAASFEADFVTNLQYFLEQEIIGLLAAACELGHELADRKTLNAREIELLENFSCKFTPESKLSPREKTPRRKKSTGRKASAKKSSSAAQGAQDDQGGQGTSSQAKKGSAKKGRGRPKKSER